MSYRIELRTIHNDTDELVELATAPLNDGENEGQAEDAFYRLLRHFKTHLVNEEKAIEQDIERLKEEEANIF